MVADDLDHLINMLAALALIPQAFLGVPGATILGLRLVLSWPDHGGQQLRPDASPVWKAEPVLFGVVLDVFTELNN